MDTAENQGFGSAGSGDGVRCRSKTRADAMSQAEETLKHYQRLAQETVEKARLERQRLQVAESGRRPSAAAS